MRSRPTASLLLAGSSLALIACASSPATVITESASVVATSDGDAPEPAPVIQARRVDLNGLLCDDRPRCKIVSSTRAGRDASGNALHVVALSLRPSANGSSDDQAEPPPEDEDAASCEPIEHWLVASNEQGFIEQSASLLLDLCNDGYGAAGIGEDQIEIADGVLRHNQIGGSTWRWSSGRTLQLSTLRLLQSDNTGYWALGPTLGEMHWDWTTFSGTRSWFSPPCDAQGAPAWPEDVEPPRYQYTIIPQLHLDDAFLKGQWKDTSLGSCAARIDASGKGGYLLRGESGDAKDATLRVVAGSATELFINVEDDQWQSDNGAIDKQDHLQLWLGAQSFEQSNQCLDLQHGLKPKVYLIRMSDGQVLPGANIKSKDAKPKVELSRSERGVHLKVTLPEEPKGLTVAYADSDTKGKIERVIATSALKASDPATLGDLEAIGTEAARCVVSGGELRAQQVPIIPSREKPALP